MRLAGWRYYLSSIPTLIQGFENWPMFVAAVLGWNRRRPFVMRLRGGGLRFEVRSALDAWIVKETCLDRDYERMSVDLQDGWTVVDIGAGLGDFAVHAAAGRPNSRVFAFEPSPESFALLQRNIALNGTRNVAAYPTAVSGGAGDVMLDTREKELARRGSRADTDGGMRVPTTTLDHVFSDLSIQDCNYLKIDTEGAEYSILFDASPSTLERIQHVCLEFHERASAFGRTDLVAFFRGHGFETAVRENPVHPDTGLLYARCRA